MPIKLEQNKEHLWKGCILAGIAHAIMVGKYPMMANEQSWDGLNYSIQDSSGQRGTVSFRNEYCVAAFRNDSSTRINSPIDLNKYFEGAEEYIIRLANEEALQYLLDEIDGEVKPIITTAFWGGEELITNDTLLEMLSNGGNLLEIQFCEIAVAIQRWKDIYEMNDNQVKLLKLLYERKIANPNQAIKLSKDGIELIGVRNDDGIVECKESFAEMNIFWD